MIYKPENKDENLLVVAAVEGCAQRRNMREKQVFELFKNAGIDTMIRKHYSVLHTQALEETIDFAEALLNKKTP